jgi:cysteine desulfurase family protein (TIGR01976 family)
MPSDLMAFLRVVIGVFFFQLTKFTPKFFTMLNTTHIRQQFPALQRVHQGKPLVFLDGPAGTQVPQRVIDAISHYYQTSNANTHGEFLTTNETDRVVEGMRMRMAALLNAEGPATISIGQNMTTLNFALARAIARSLQPGDEVLITQLDHEGNRGPWLMLREWGITVREVRLLPTGRLDYEDMAAKINERTRLVAMGLASNAIGTVNNVKIARELSYKAGAWLLLDAVHYAPHFSIDVQQLGCDFLLCSAYKFYGPHIGLLYSRPGLLDQLHTDRLRTAGQTAPDKIETGTLNHAAIHGVSAAIDFLASLGKGDTLRNQLVDAYRQVGAHEYALAKSLYDGLAAIPGVRVAGTDFADPHRAPTVSFTVTGKTATEVCRHLAADNIFAWDGHFYAIRAIETLGLLEQGGVTRIGMAVYNTPEEVQQTLARIRSLI